MNKKIKESDLQTWFEDKSRRQTIADFITNTHILNTQPIIKNKNITQRDKSKIIAINKAKKVLSKLTSAKLISGNLSISERGDTQLRPDLVLISEEADYLLIELKARKETERQAVQELLAYSAAIKMQLPFSNEIMFIIVSYHWDTLLRLSVQSLIMDGKYVLPLALGFGENGEYNLHIKGSLFDYETEHLYDPLYAMVPHTIATAFPRNKNTFHKQKENVLLRHLNHIFYDIYRECKNDRQSGLIMLWARNLLPETTIFNLTVITVNQFWEYSESYNGLSRLIKDTSRYGMRRLQQNVATKLRGEIYHREDNSNQEIDELDEIFLSIEKQQAEAALYPQSSRSLDLLLKYTSIDNEKTLIDNGIIELFDHASYINLESFLYTLTETHDHINIDKAFTFGDLSDFFIKETNSPFFFDKDVHWFMQQINKFIRFKSSRADQKSL